jgi:hypothetical protein
MSTTTLRRSGAGRDHLVGFVDRFQGEAAGVEAWREHSGVREGGCLTQDLAVVVSPAAGQHRRQREHP